MQLNLTAKEFDDLQRFVHLSAMCLMTWPPVVKKIMETPKEEDK